MNLTFLKTWWSMASILLMPAVAMVYTDEVKWSPSDFFIASILLLCLATVLHFVWHSKLGLSKKWWIILAVLLLFILVWAELAVGIFNTPWAGS